MGGGGSEPGCRGGYISAGGHGHVTNGILMSRDIRF